MRDSGGIPFEKSIRGSGCGVASNVASQFTSGHRQMACTQKRKNPGQREQPAMQPAAMRLHHQQPGEEHRHQQDRAAIQRQRIPAADFSKGLKG